MSKVITTNELDDMARDFFPAIRACAKPDASEEDRKNADTALKLLRQGTSRMSGENNRLATYLKVAKAVSVPAERMQWIWDSIAPANASIEEARKTRGSLAPGESTS